MVPIRSSPNPPFSAAARKIWWVEAPFKVLASQAYRTGGWRAWNTPSSLLEFLPMVASACRGASLVHAKIFFGYSDLDVPNGTGTQFSSSLPPRLRLASPSSSGFLLPTFSSWLLFRFSRPLRLCRPSPQESPFLYAESHEILIA